MKAVRLFPARCSDLGPTVGKSQNSVCYKAAFSPNDLCFSVKTRAMEVGSHFTPRSIYTHTSVYLLSNRFMYKVSVFRETKHQNLVSDRDSGVLNMVSQLPAHLQGSTPQFTTLLYARVSWRSRLLLPNPKNRSITTTDWC